MDNAHDDDPDRNRAASDLPDSPTHRSATESTDEATRAYEPGITPDPTDKFPANGTQIFDSGRPADSRPAFLAPSTRTGSLGRLGHYEVDRVLGQGAFGVVLHAVDERLRREVAIKVMAAHVADDPAFRERFLREARAVAAIHSPHVVQLFEVADDPLLYLVMEYVNGQTLSAVIDGQGQLEVRVIVRIGLQIALGLAAAHAQGKIHRDIKPANILLASVPGAATASAADGTVKITDFGLVRAIDDAKFTQSGVITGTPLYMSPEQARGEQLDARSDLFSLGNVLYTLCTRQPAFKADRTLGVLKRVCDEVPQPIQQINLGIPDWLSAVVNRLLEKTPAARFQSADEVADLLQRYLAHLNDPTRELPVLSEAFSATIIGEPEGQRSGRSRTEVIAREERRFSHRLLTGIFVVALMFASFLSGYQWRRDRDPVGAKRDQVSRNNSLPENTPREESNIPLPVVKLQEQARSLLQKSLTEQPDNAAVAGALAELSLAEIVDPNAGPAEDPNRELLRTEIRNSGLRGFAALGASRFERADWTGAADALQRATALHNDARTIEWLLLALSEVEMDLPDKAMESYEKAMKGIDLQRLDGLTTLLVRRAMITIEGVSSKAADARLRTWSDRFELADLTIALGSNPTKSTDHIPRAMWFARRGRWKEAAQDHVARTRLNKDILAWHPAAATLLLAGDRAGYDALCERGAILAQNSDDWLDVEVLCKHGMLVEGKSLDALEEPLKKHWDFIDKNKVQDVGRDFMMATEGLAAYRHGDFSRALELCNKVPLPSPGSAVEVGDIKTMLAAFTLLTRAMAQFKLHEPSEAQRDYDRAVALIPKELKLLGTNEYSGPLPVDQRIVDHDWLIAEILRREAEKLLATASPE